MDVYRNKDRYLFVEMDDPGDYYRHKAQCAYLLREAIKIVEEVRDLEPHAKAIYDRILAVLRSRLEIAEYVGD